MKTINITDDMHYRLKLVALEERVKLKDLINKIIGNALEGKSLRNKNTINRAKEDWHLNTIK